MKSLVFPFFISFGKLDSVSAEVECSLSEKDAKRLERSAQDGGRLRLDEDEDISDIYDKVYDLIISSEKKALTANPSPVENALSWDDDYDLSAPITDAQIDDYLAELDIGILYPQAMQMLARSGKRNRRQTQCETRILDREQAKEFLDKSENENTIVLVDQGRVLVYIPKKYAGKLTIPSGVQQIERDAIRNRKKIAEIVIDNGLPEIPDECFEGCESLQTISVPASVKRIGYNAFAGCRSLSSVTLSEGVLEIDNTAFRFCGSLKALRIPGSVASVSMHINSYFNGLRDLYFAGVETSVDGSRGGDWRWITMHVKSGSCAEAFAKQNGIRFAVDMDE